MHENQDRVSISCLHIDNILSFYRYPHPHVCSTQGNQWNYTNADTLISLIRFNLPLWILLPNLLNTYFLRMC